MRTIFSSVLAGLFISIGATVFLLCDNRYIGAMLFAVGLLSIKRYGLALFTGRVPYALDGDAVKNAFELCMILIGNIMGTMLAAAMLTHTRLSFVLVFRSTEIIQAKSSDSALSLFILGAFCNIMIYLATRDTENHIQNTIALIYGVIIFVLCGFEHCVANCFYEMLAKSNASWFFPVVAGNAVGGIVIHELIKYVNEKEQEEPVCKK